MTGERRPDRVRSLTVPAEPRKLSGGTELEWQEVVLREKEA